MDTIIKRIIRAAIESFPISERKKAELLQNIRKRKSGEGNDDVSQ